MTETEQPSDNSGILKASGPSPDRIAVGLAVFSVDGKRLGSVKEVRGDEFLIDRPMARDYWVPFSAVVRAGQLVARSDVDQRWTPRSCSP